MDERRHTRGLTWGRSRRYWSTRTPRWPTCSRTRPADPDRAAALVARVRPGQRVQPDGEEPWELADAVFPPVGTVCALSVPGLEPVDTGPVTES
ncbi:DUF6928 family protein [Plantactinospora sonchi]|uniref:DUF6928 family protein n=1 Tax=Plantactinospora sonchi TaxID=1544735 RepID=UPI0038B531A1